MGLQRDTAAIFMDGMKPSEKLKLATKARKSNQSKLARAIGVTQQQLSDWFNEEGRPYFDQVVAMARELSISLDWLADEADDSPIPPVPSEKERQVREIVSRIGWEGVYWCVVDSRAKESRELLRPTSPTYAEEKEAARKLSDQLDRKSS